MEEVRYAGVGLRFVAILIDSIILGIVAYLFAAASGQAQAGGFTLDTGQTFLFSLIGLAYFVILEKFGGTLGKMAIGLRVRKDDGSTVGYGDTLIRNILRLVDDFPYIIPYLLGAILIWTSPKKQRLGDRLAKTVIVRK